MKAVEPEGFGHRTLPSLGKRVHRMGFALNFGLGPAEFDLGLERGMNYLYWTWMRTGALLPGMQAALRKDRARYVVATGPTLGFFAGNVRRGCERVLRSLRTEYIDYFQLNWLGVTSAYTPATVDALLALKAEGKIRAIGASIHDRPRAGRLAADSALDMLMIRYNAAHPGAERDIFPSFTKRRPELVAYTATAWRKLLKRPSGWEGNVPTAPDCYRFCLSNPNVDVVLMGAANRAQLEENLTAMERGPLSPEEDTFMREFGAKAHG